MQQPVFLDDDDPLPPTSEALGPGSQAPGLLAVGGTLTPERLALAYCHGVFPWFSEGQPVLWWSPDPRMVLPTQAFKLTRSMRKTLKRFLLTPGCEVRIDTAFDRVIQACAATPRHGHHGTWILPPMVAAYQAWHLAGAVHSFETWVDGALVGGLYGVNLGRMFFGESMFSHQTDASKIALAALIAFCRANQIPLIDCQQNTSHLASMGAHEITRQAFETHVTHAVAQTAPTDWTYHASTWQHLNVFNDSPPEPS